MDVHALFVMACGIGDQANYIFKHDYVQITDRPSPGCIR